MTEPRVWTRDDTRRYLRVPDASDDKFSRGTVGLWTGSERYPGAAVLSVEGAWRAGAGFVRYVGSAASGVLQRRPETVCASGRVDAWVIGSGMDVAVRTADETAGLSEILAGTAPVVVDAGALDLVPGARAPLVITPHAREFARLRERLHLGPETGDRAGDAAQVARTLGRTVLLKGASTVIAASDGVLLSVDNGPGWLATAGSGDVLAGVIGAMVAAHPAAPFAEVTAAAAWVHAEAARRAAGVTDRHPGHPIVASDIAAALPGTIGDLLA